MGETSDKNSYRKFRLFDGGSSALAVFSKGIFLWGDGGVLKPGLANQGGVGISEDERVTLTLKATLSLIIWKLL